MGLVPFPAREPLAPPPGERSERPSSQGVGHPHLRPALPSIWHGEHYVSVAYQTAGQEHSVIAAPWARTGPILQMGKLSLESSRG